VLALLLPLLLLLALEAALRLAGYGYSPAFFKPLQRGAERLLVENDKFGWRFFPPAVARAPAPVVLPARKAPGTYRIFVFGESAALGDPRPAYGFSRFLEVLLRERFPDGRFEVVNVAMTAINSHALREIARECARLEGNLWLVYTGNNEYYGPFGAGTVFGTAAPPLWWARAQLALQRTRLGQWLTAQLAPPPGTLTNWTGLQLFLGRELAPDDPRRARVQEHFARNLEALIREGLGAGARVLVGSMAVNLRECGPFASRHAAGLSGADQREWAKLFETALALQQTGATQAVLPLWRKAVEESPAHAEARFRLAEAELVAGNRAAAAPEFARAADCDALPFRADSILNRLARELAQKYAARGVDWVDTAAALAAAAPGGVPGAESFFEHVHLNFAGNYRLARAFAEAIVPRLPAAWTNRATAEWAAPELCARRLGLTDWNRAAVLEGILSRVLEAPYTNQTHADERLRRLWAELETVRQNLTPAARAEARAVYEEALSRTPDDHRLHENYAEFLEATGDLPGALAHWTRVRDLLPHHLSGWFHTGRLLSRLRKPAEARAALEQTLRLRPDLVEALLELAVLDVADGRLDTALRRCDTALRLRPGEARVHLRRADVLMRLKRRDEALAALREAIRVQPTSWEAHYLLGVELAVDEKLKEAETEFAEVVRLRPDHVLGRLNLGIALAKQARFDEAEVQLNEVLKRDPVNARALQALETLQKFREAAEKGGTQP
jgi:tetratricopeptide (TPR) repeat protein